MLRPDHLTVTPDQVAAAHYKTAPHCRSLIQALGEGVALVIVTPGDLAFEVPTDKPAISILVDDLVENAEHRGPGYFHTASTRRLIETCRAGLVTSAAPMEPLYRRIATTAVLLRRHCLIVETRPEHDANWLALVRSTNPTMGLLVATVRPEGRA